MSRGLDQVLQKKNIQMTIKTGKKKKKKDTTAESEEELSPLGESESGE